MISYEKSEWGGKNPKWNLPRTWQSCFVLQWDRVGCYFRGESGQTDDEERHGGQRMDPHAHSSFHQWTHSSQSAGQAVRCASVWYCVLSRPPLRPLLLQKTAPWLCSWSPCAIDRGWVGLFPWDSVQFRCGYWQDPKWCQYGIWKLEGANSTCVFCRMFSKSPAIPPSPWSKWCPSFNGLLIVWSLVRIARDGKASYKGVPSRLRETGRENQNFEILILPTFP